MQPARNPQKLFLLDGPIMETAERRLRVVAEMATVLIANNAWHNFDDARLTLRMSGYTVTEVHCLLADAMAAAGYETQHEAVATAMSEP
jgi:hypothetical protein